MANLQNNSGLYLLTLIKVRVSGRDKLKLQSIKTLCRYYDNKSALVSLCNKENRKRINLKKNRYYNLFSKREKHIKSNATTLAHSVVFLDKETDNQYAIVVQNLEIH